MNLIKKLNELGTRKGFKKLLKARGRNESKFEEILETAKNQDIDREALKYYLANLGEVPVSRDPQATFSIGFAIGVLGSGALFIYSVQTKEPMAALLGLLTPIPMGGLSALYGWQGSRRFESYEVVRQRALENITQKRQDHYYLEGATQ